MNADKNVTKEAEPPLTKENDSPAKDEEEVLALSMVTIEDKEDATEALFESPLLKDNDSSAKEEVLTSTMIGEGDAITTEALILQGAGDEPSPLKGENDSSANDEVFTSPIMKVGEDDTEAPLIIPQSSVESKQPFCLL